MVRLEEDQAQDEAITRRLCRNFPALLPVMPFFNPKFGVRSVG
jgi:hypothetical protein